MTKIFIIISIIIVISSCSLTRYDITKNNTINWNSEDGINMLDRSQYKTDFYQLANFFQPQINPLYCGIASSVIILNAINSSQKIASQSELEIEKPDIFGGGIIPFNSYSQLTFLNKKTNKIKEKNIINMKNINDNRENIDPGLTLTQLKNILEIYDLDVQKYHISKSSQKELDFFREKVKKITADNKKYLIINFHGKKIGMTTGGHLSPLVAYDHKSDSVLMMDVAGHKNNWYWVNIRNLFNAMNTVDGKNYRGYLVIGKKTVSKIL